MKKRNTDSVGKSVSGPPAGPQALGKADERLLEKVVYRNLGETRESVLVGPRRGFDNAVIRIDERKVMIVTTDPVSIIPALGMEASAWLSVHLIASDYATSSAQPEYASFDFNLPVELRRGEAELYLSAVGAECKELGISIVGGHTGTYPGAQFTVVGGGTIFGFCGADDYVDPSMGRVGDVVLMTKGAAIETTATLANSFPSYTEARLGRTRARAARKYTYSCSVVKDALVAASVGIRSEGVTSMHDATEGGVLGAMHELALSSGHAILADPRGVHVPAEASLLCSAFGIDPLSSLSEGTLLITCRGERVAEVKKRLTRNGIPVFNVGEVREGSGLWLLGPDGRKTPHRPVRDPFWAAYSRALKAGLT